MGYISINISMDVKQYYQNEEDWKDLVLRTGDETSTIGKSGCGLTCGAMLEKKSPKMLYENYNMKDLLCDWTKLPTYSISHESVRDAEDAAFKLFIHVVLNKKPIILFGDDGEGTDYSTHFVIIRGFQGKVAVDPDGNYFPADSSLAPFKVYDPSTVPGYGNATNADEFNNRFPIKSFRVPTKK
ncbi:hypothetical protein [Sedimentibacter sp.]|uniref:hypothetical protein n=1 Tax=Sedimentibacter sp. TaxID=1960295 RepID=UPI0028AA8EE8|nr:hypothetical protein [Sedimentibacter sp.]